MYLMRQRFNPYCPYLDIVSLIGNTKILELSGIWKAKFYKSKPNSIFIFWTIWARMFDRLNNYKLNNDEFYLPDKIKK